MTTISRRMLQLVRSEADCAKVCSRRSVCAALRQVLGPGQFSVMAYYSHQTSIDTAITMCPGGALTLVDAPPRTD